MATPGRSLAVRGADPATHSAETAATRADDLGDDLGLAKFSASVAWASFEIPKGVTRYRAGVEFNDAEVVGDRRLLHAAQVMGPFLHRTTRRPRTSRG